MLFKKVIHQLLWHKIEQLQKVFEQEKYNYVSQSIMNYVLYPLL